MTELPEEDYPEIWPRPELLKPADLAAAAELNAGDAGDPLAFRRRFFDEDPEAAAVVPCRGCRECCYHPNVDVDPEREPPENLARLDLERR